MNLILIEFYNWYGYVWILNIFSKKGKKNRSFFWFVKNDLLNYSVRQRSSDSAGGDRKSDIFKQEKEWFKPGDQRQWHSNRYVKIILPDSFEFENFKTNQKQALFSFVYFLLNFLFSGKQKKIMKVFYGSNQIFWSLQQVLTLKMFSKNENKPEIGFVFFCLVFH